MLNLNSLLMSSQTPQKLVDFYRRVLARDVTWDEGEYKGFKVGDGALVIGPHGNVRGPSQNPERIIFNLETGDVKGEFERIKGLGAKVIAEPYAMGEDQDFLIATLADPDGNYFQLMSPMEN